MNKILSLQVVPSDYPTEPLVYALGEDGKAYKLWRGNGPAYWMPLPALPGEKEPDGGAKT